jgi:hypothetical protein
MPGPLDPLAPITYGRNFNFFKKVTVTSPIFQFDADMIITFPTQGLALLNQDGYGAIVQVSYNGVSTDDELDSSQPSKGIFYDVRQISKIWFKIVSGNSAIVSVRAWGTR